MHYRNTPLLLALLLLCCPSGSLLAQWISHREAARQYLIEGSGKGQVFFENTSKIRLAYAYVELDLSAQTAFSPRMFAGAGLFGYANVARNGSWGLLIGPRLRYFLLNPASRRLSPYAEGRFSFLHRAEKISGEGFRISGSAFAFGSGLLWRVRPRMGLDGSLFYFSSSKTLVQAQDPLTQKPYFQEGESPAALRPQLSLVVWITTPRHE
jgi:hypothetical protein